MNPNLAYRKLLGAVLISTATLFCAKVFGLVDISWTVILSPLWFPTLVGVFAIGGALMLAEDT
jgi:hypothetical protein